MPYFTRKSFADTLAEAGAAAVPAPTGAAPSIMALADGILAEEATDGVRTGPFRVRAPVRPGETGTMTLGLAGEGPGQLALRLTPDDLVGPGGAHIPARNVALSASEIELAPGAERDLTVTISVPADSRPGLYAGQIAGGGAVPLVAAIEVEVAD